MAKIYRGLLYSMGAEEEETEKAVAAIRERKMAKLFENVPKNIEAEKRRTRKQIRLLQEELNNAQSERDTIQKELNNTQNERDAIQEERNAIQKSFTIYKHITNLRMAQKTDSEIITSLMETFSLTKGQAEEEFKKALEE